MAYNIEDRFPRVPKYYRFLDPGAYQELCSLPTCSYKKGPSKAPFLSKAPRVTCSANPIWTHAYYNEIPRKIVPNCTSLKSKLPRFSYEAFSKQDLEELLCRCGLETICECPTGVEQEKDDFCQGKKQIRLFKGAVPQPITEDTVLKKPTKFVYDPPFYDTRIKESTSYYHGWKWSKRMSKREPKAVDFTPGPAHYNVGDLHLCGRKDKCAEELQFSRKKYSKQLRYIEQLTEQNLLENRPGPASYNPKIPKGTELMFLGSQSKRFPSSTYIRHPGPFDYLIKRDFDPVDCHNLKPCLAKLPERSCFGNKAPRFKPQMQVGPSPADYEIKNKLCHVLHCNNAPFGSTAVRFPGKNVESNHNLISTTKSNEQLNENETEIEECPKLSWSFKSKVKRFSTLTKNPNSPSPADMPQARTELRKSDKRSNTAPFLCSDVRFSPWYNWVPMHQGHKTPGPCYYNAEKVRCSPAVNHGPLNRTCRFKSNATDVPSPNAYNVGGGIETVLQTHNKRLNENIKMKIKTKDLVYKPPPTPRRQSYREQELALLKQCLDILNIGEELFADQYEEPRVIEKQPDDTSPPKKLLRCFLYSHYYHQSF